MKNFELVKIFFNIFDGDGINGGGHPWLLLLILVALYSILRTGTVSVKKLGRRSDQSHTFIAIPLAFVYIMAGFVAAFLGFIVMCSGKEPLHLIADRVLSSGNKIYYEVLGICVIALTVFLLFGRLTRKSAVVRAEDDTRSLDTGPVVGLIPALITALLMKEYNREDEDKPVILSVFESFGIDLIALFYTIIITMIMLIAPAEYLSKHWIWAIYLYSAYMLAIKLFLAFISVIWIGLFRVREHEDRVKGQTLISRFYGTIRKRALRRSISITFCFGLIFCILVPLFYKMLIPSRLTENTKISSYGEEMLYVPIEDTVRTGIVFNDSEYFLYEQETETVVINVPQVMLDDFIKSGKFQGQTNKISTLFYTNTIGLSELNGKPLSQWAILSDKRPDPLMYYMGGFLLILPTILILYNWITVFVPKLTADYRRARKRNKYLPSLLNDANQDLLSGNSIHQEGSFTVTRNFFIDEQLFPFQIIPLKNVASLEYLQPLNSLGFLVTGYSDIKTQKTRITIKNVTPLLVDVIKKLTTDSTAS